MYLEVAYIRNAANDKSVTCSCVSDGIYFDLRSWSTWRTAQTYEKLSVLSIFGHCGPLPQDFRQVQAQIILCFIQIMRVCLIIVYPMVFILVCDEAQHGECSDLPQMLNFKYL